MNRRPDIAGLILAGGASRRMGTPKALLRFQDETFLDRLIRIYSEATDPVIVVLGHQAEQIRSGLACPGRAIFVVNPDPERGMLTSLQCGLQAAPATCDAVMFTPVDHPHLKISTLQTLASRFVLERALVTVPTYGGEHGHPVCVAQPLIAELLALPETAMASDVIHRHVPKTSYFEVDDPATVTDIDDQSAYEHLMAAQNSAPRVERP